MFELKQLTIEEFTDKISDPKINLKFVFPDRFRYFYLFEKVFILNDHWSEQIMLS